MLIASVFSLIIYKLNYWQKFYIVIFFKFDKNSKIYIYFSILILNLLIYLRIEYSKNLVLDFEKAAK